MTRVHSPLDFPKTLFHKKNVNPQGRCIFYLASVLRIINHAWFTFEKERVLEVGLAWGFQEGHDCALGWSITYHQQREISERSVLNIIDGFLKEYNVEVYSQHYESTNLHLFTRTNRLKPDQSTVDHFAGQRYKPKREKNASSRTSSSKNRPDGSGGAGDTTPGKEGCVS